MPLLLCTLIYSMQNTDTSGNENIRVDCFASCEKWYTPHNDFGFAEEKTWPTQKQNLSNRSIRSENLKINSKMAEKKCILNSLHIYIMLHSKFIFFFGFSWKFKIVTHREHRALTTKKKKINKNKKMNFFPKWLLLSRFIFFCRANS